MRDLSPTMDFVIRTYRSGDLSALQDLTVDAFEPVSMDRNIEREFGVVNDHDWRWRKRRHIEQDVERDPRGAFVAELNGRIVGYITTWIDEQAGFGNIPNLAVAADQRGRGLGRKLIEHALDHFRRQGMQCARIETLEQNPVGQNLYPACGFREIARQIHYCVDLQHHESSSPKSNR